MLKRCFDISFSAAVLLLAWPLLALIALLIKLDSPGPFLFKQIRVGRHGSAFKILKFRTMHVQKATHDSKLTVQNDPRVTQIGKILRATKLDELPQFWNVLVGDMSIVGPRPEVPEFVAKYPPAIKEKLKELRPGITDKASLEFRNESELLQASQDPYQTYLEQILPIKLRYYVAYAEQHSFCEDLKIVFATFLTMFGVRQTALPSEDISKTSSKTV